MFNQLRVLIVCRHNSSRSQIAEAYFNHLHGERIYAESAGLEPAAGIDPLVVEVMKEEGLNLSRKIPQSIYDCIERGSIFDHIITFCNDTELYIPIIPGTYKRWHVLFPNTSHVIGSHEEQLTQIRSIRDMIKKWIEENVADVFIAKACLFKHKNDIRQLYNDHWTLQHFPAVI